MQQLTVAPASPAVLTARRWLQARCCCQPHVSLLPKPVVATPLPVTLGHHSPATPDKGLDPFAYLLSQYPSSPAIFSLAEG